MSKQNEKKDKKLELIKSLSKEARELKKKGKSNSLIDDLATKTPEELYDLHGEEIDAVIKSFESFSKALSDASVDIAKSIKKAFDNEVMQKAIEDMNKATLEGSLKQLSAGPTGLGY